MKTYELKEIITTVKVASLYTGGMINALMLPAVREWVRDITYGEVTIADDGEILRRENSYYNITGDIDHLYITKKVISYEVVDAIDSINEELDALCEDEENRCGYWE